MCELNVLIFQVGESSVQGEAIAFSVERLI